MPPDNEKKPPQPAPSNLRIAVTIGLAMFETLLFSGISYGVVSLVPMLNDRGVYSHLCGPNATAGANSTATCSTAREQITLAFTITQVVTPFGNLASGLLLDRWGFRVVKTVAAALFGLGTLCFTLVQPGADWLIFPGTMLLGISGIQVIMSNLQLSTMVKFPFVVASILSGLFDACTMVTSALVQISRSNVNSFIAFGVYTGLGVLTISLTVALYPGKYNRLHVESKTISLASLRSQKPKKNIHQQQDKTVKKSEMGSAETPEASEIEEGQRCCSAFQFLLTTDFFLMILWMICNNLRLNYFFGSLSAYVDVITNGDKELVDDYSTMFGYFFLTSPLVSLLPGLLLDLQKRFIPALRENTHRTYKLNTVTTLSLTVLIGVTSCLMMLPNSTDILIPVYIAIAVFRAFLYSTLGNYCISVFKPENFGIVYTSIICTAAPFMFLTVPLTNWMEDSRQPDTINYILAGLICVSLIHPLVLFLRNIRSTGRQQVQPVVVNPDDFDTHL